MKHNSKKILFLLAVMGIVGLSGCASFKDNQQEHKQLNAIHKAERTIKQGNVDIALGTALIAKGTKTVITGKAELKKAKNELAQSVGIKAEASKPKA